MSGVCPVLFAPGILHDAHLLEEIAELTGIEYRILSRAFVGEEKNLALDVEKTAVAENPRGTPEEWQDHILSWAKKNGTVEYRPGYWNGYELTHEYNEYLRSIGGFRASNQHRRT